MSKYQPVSVIKTDEQYQAYLSEVEMLLEADLDSNSEESKRLEVLTVLIESYEKENYSIEPINPIDAIKFRMAERGLKQIDLAPYFGTKSRVSEVLSGKRPLTVPMIRSLSVGLGIAPQILLGLENDSGYSSTPKEGVNWSKFPIKEMVSRGWIKNAGSTIKNGVEEQVKSFIEQLGGTSASASFKRTLSGDAYSPSSKYKLFAWVARVIQKSRDGAGDKVPYDPSVINKDFLRDVAHLSWSDYGPKLAVEFLEKHGIRVVIEPALRGTAVDGAALKDNDGTPIIALTLRQDRLDNFWFTLLHELVHVWKHVDLDKTFIDDIELMSDSKDKIEAEANRIARDTLIPRIAWKRSEAYLSPSASSIEMLSRELRIHPSIIAGRLRRELGRYNQFSDLIGQGEVRKHFPSQYW
ncbi:MAG: ImmA/IrrE family metallo-endopeptidase [Parashewanella sp.]